MGFRAILALMRVPEPIPAPFVRDDVPYCSTTCPLFVESLKMTGGPRARRMWKCDVTGQRETVCLPVVRTQARLLRFHQEG